jgi:CRP/FNR family nitrogen fixation transcriptional regulator
MSAAYAISDNSPAGVPAANFNGAGGDALLDVIEAMGVRMSFGKDEEIYGQGEEADLVYRIVRGHVRTVRCMADGRRQVGGFHGVGDVFGVEAGAEHRFSAEALDDCVLMVLRRSVLRSQAAADPRIERRLWALTVHELEMAQEHMLLLGRKTACEKVASFLLVMAADEDCIELAMGRQDMADYLGLTIETVSRMLTQLQCSGFIAFPQTRRLKVRDRRGLADLSE